MTDQPTATRPPFLVRGVAAIKHLNVRKEGPDDEKILAVDVKMEIKNVDRRLCAYFDDALEAFLWRGNTDALIARNAFLVPVSYSNEISNANVTIGTRSYIGCDVKKLSMEPRDGGVMALTCSVALYPNSNDVADLANLVQDEEHILIEGPPDLFAFPVPAATAGDAHDLLSADSDQMYEQVVDLVHNHRKALRRAYSVNCPMCAQQRPRANPSVLLPQQRCRLDGYRDPRAELTNEQWCSA